MGKIVIINGPNLNFLGQREIDKYGTTTYKELISELEDYTNNQDELIFINLIMREKFVNLSKTFSIMKRLTV